MLRCPGKRHAEVIEPGTGIIEVKCDSRVCGAGHGNVVLHRFNVGTEQLVETLRYKNPKGETNAIDNQPRAIRSA